jgi:hypothetical protein
LNGFTHPEAGANRASLPHPAVKQTTRLVLRRRPGRSHRDLLLPSLFGTQYRNLSLGRPTVWYIAQLFYFKPQDKISARLDRPKLSLSRTDVKGDSSTVR